MTSKKMHTAHLSLHPKDGEGFLISISPRYWAVIHGSAEEGLARQKFDFLFNQVRDPCILHGGDSTLGLA